jgi:hypothetical protein
MIPGTDLDDLDDPADRETKGARVVQGRARQFDCLLEQK